MIFMRRSFAAVPVACPIGLWLRRTPVRSALDFSRRQLAERIGDQGRRSVCTYCFIVSYVGVAYPPAEWR
jgi:hypothetical protein